MSQSAKGLRVLSSSGLVISKIANCGKKSPTGASYCITSTFLDAPSWCNEGDKSGLAEIRTPPRIDVIPTGIFRCVRLSQLSLQQALFCCHMCVCRSKRNMVSKERQPPSVQLLSLLCLVCASQEGDSDQKIALFQRFSKSKLLKKIVPLEWYELNWSVCM